MLNTDFIDVLNFRNIESVCENKLALTNSEGTSFTYEELRSVVSKIAARLSSRFAGISSGTVLISTGSKVLDATISLSCMALGGRFTILDRQKDAAHKSHVCAHSDATNVIVGSDDSDLNEWVTPNVQVVWTAKYEGFSVNLTTNQPKLGTHPQLARQSCSLLPQALFYTSGSTGQPKGIVVARTQLLDGAECVAKYLALTADDTILSYLPISFDYGFNQIMTGLSIGATVVLEDTFAPLQVKDHFDRFTPTVFPGSPSIFLNLGKLIRRRLAVDDFASLRLVTNTGGRVPELGHEFIRMVVEAHGVKPFLMYGLTESFRSSYLPPNLYHNKHNAIGRAVPGVSLYLQDEQGRIVEKPNTIGEIIHAGRLISYGYYKDPQATERLISRLNHPAFDGVPNPPQAVKSGDLGWFDEDGIFFHAGRKDNLIKVREQRTSLDQIEDILTASGYFDVSVVVPDKDQDGLTIIHIFGSLSTTAPLDAAELRRALVEVLPMHLAGFKLTLRQDLPTNLNGKICRKTLSAELAPKDNPRQNA